MSRDRRFLREALPIEAEDTLRGMRGIVGVARREPVARRRIVEREAIAESTLIVFGRYWSKALHKAVSRPVVHGGLNSNDVRHPVAP